ncbi:hypothetical protein SAMD00019534_054230 [Acytostelium subglobosum LB1]|uniref:hypothetical protein n=1 Tax=Acytostelium subglobosum LB1 TaxID=1410327 RepID=UPI0006451281|nr:hypothetical protein SAMD00019534_054230 [Acytostelium subglobosum LB1]GAM22248.1 hypothetical protein SAMD00019534_054230 [Acytostelium subglobosum LB1]|eukprot:XP_012754368.1 hypothetical protein SAMD00019534_054230 [Acytostelium subglobosum LB1]
MLRTVGALLGRERWLTTSLRLQSSSCLGKVWTSCDDTRLPTSSSTLHPNSTCAPRRSYLSISHQSYSTVNTTTSTSTSTTKSHDQSYDDWMALLNLNPSAAIDELRIRVYSRHERSSYYAGLYNKIKESNHRPSVELLNTLLEGAVSVKADRSLVESLADEVIQREKPQNTGRTQELLLQYYLTHYKANTVYFIKPLDQILQLDLALTSVNMSTLVLTGLLRKVTDGDHDGLDSAMEHFQHSHAAGLLDMHQLAMVVNLHLDNNQTDRAMQIVQTCAAAVPEYLASTHFLKLLDSLITSNTNELPLLEYLAENHLLDFNNIAFIDQLVEFYNQRGKQTIAEPLKEMVKMSGKPSKSAAFASIVRALAFKEDADIKKWLDYLIAHSFSIVPSVYIELDEYFAANKMDEWRHKMRVHQFGEHPQQLTPMVYVDSATILSRYDLLDDLSTKKAITDVLLAGGRGDHVQKLFTQLVLLFLQINRIDKAMEWYNCMIRDFKIAPTEEIVFFFIRYNSLSENEDAARHWMKERYYRGIPRTDRIDLYYTQYDQGQYREALGNMFDKARLVDPLLRVVQLAEEGRLSDIIKEVQLRPTSLSIELLANSMLFSKLICNERSMVPMIELMHKHWTADNALFIREPLGDVINVLSLATQKIDSPSIKHQVVMLCSQLLEKQIHMYGGNCTSRTLHHYINMIIDANVSIGEVPAIIIQYLDSAFSNVIESYEQEVDSRRRQKKEGRQYSTERNQVAREDIQHMSVVSYMLWKLVQAGHFDKCIRLFEELPYIDNRCYRQVLLALYSGKTSISQARWRALVERIDHVIIHNIVEMLPTLLNDRISIKLRMEHLMNLSARLDGKRFAIPLSLHERLQQHLVLCKKDTRPERGAIQRLIDCSIIDQSSMGEPPITSLHQYMIRQMFGLSNP